MHLLAPDFLRGCRTLASCMKGIASFTAVDVVRADFLDDGFEIADAYENIHEPPNADTEFCSTMFALPSF